MRLSTLPRIGVTCNCRPRACNCAIRRTAPVPTGRPGGSSASVRPSAGDQRVARILPRRHGRDVQAAGARRWAGPCTSARRSRSRRRVSASRSADTNTPTPELGDRRGGPVAGGDDPTSSTAGRSRRSARRRPAGTGPAPARCPGCRDAADLRWSRRSSPPISGSTASASRWPSRVTLQVEQFAQQRGVLVAAGLGGQLADPTVGECSSCCTTRCRYGQPRRAAPSLNSGRRWASRRSSAATTLVGAGAQRGDGRCHVGAAQPAEEVLHLGGDDLLDGGGSAAAGRRRAGSLPAGRCRSPRRRAASATSASTSRGTARSSTTSGPGRSRSASAAITGRG